MSNTTLLLIILLIPILIFHWFSFWKPLFIERKIRRDLEQASEWNKFIKTAAVDKRFYKSKLMARAIKNTIKEKNLMHQLLPEQLK